MIEKTYTYTRTDGKTIERILSDGYADINHMVLGQGDRLPLHHANANVYMIVVRGTVTLTLDNQEPHPYAAGHIINIRQGTQMDVSNRDDPIAEFFVVKTPSPTS